MAIDNSLYESLESTYIKIKVYLDNTQLGREHSAMIVKHEELSELLETFDIELLEEKSKDIHNLHAQFDTIKELSNLVVENLTQIVGSEEMTAKVVSGLDEIMLKTNNVVL